MKRVALLALLVLVGVGIAGCADTEKVLEATARAENRIGKSGSLALDSIATLGTALAATSSQTTVALATLTAHTSATLATVASHSAVFLDGATATLAAVTTRSAVILDNVAALTSALTTASDRASVAIDNVAAVISDARPAVQKLPAVMDDIHGITSETHALLTVTRANAEDGVYWKRLVIMVSIVTGSLALCSLIHSILAARRTHKHVAALHEDVRRLHKA